MPFHSQGRLRATSQSRGASCHFTVKGGVLPLHNPERLRAMMTNHFADLSCGNDGNDGNNEEMIHRFIENLLFYFVFCTFVSKISKI